MNFVAVEEQNKQRMKRIEQKLEPAEVMSPISYRNSPVTRIG